MSIIQLSYLGSFFRLAYLPKNNKYSYIIAAASIKGSINKFSSGILLISLSIRVLVSINISEE